MVDGVPVTRQARLKFYNNGAKAPPKRYAIEFEPGESMASDHPRANLKPLSLHVPEPKFRPGDTVDFAEVDIPAAGAARRPDTADDAQ